jgi:hypothetical protein
MKTLKSKIIASIMAFSLLFGVYITVNATQKGSYTSAKTLAPQWFEYTGPNSSSPNYEVEIEDPSNYSPMSAPSCTSGQELCAIFAENDSGHPTEASLESLKNQILKNAPQNPAEVRFEN